MNFLVNILKNILTQYLKFSYVIQLDKGFNGYKEPHIICYIFRKVIRMYFYVDESGQTGLNLFDKNQPCLYYGVLSSNEDLDSLAKIKVKKLRENFEIERLHAAELGVRKLSTIASDIIQLRKDHNLYFDIHTVLKADHAVISFFDQVFDQGLNPAVPWTAYWTPLRYVLLLKLSILFDEETLQSAWDARICINDTKAEESLVSICNTLKDRVCFLPDQRSRGIINDALTWASQNPSQISYNSNSKKDTLHISPNLIGFQSVIHGIRKRLKESKNKAKKIIVDRQSQFNKTQEHLMNFYQNTRDVEFVDGPDLPITEWKNIPDIPISCTPGTESVGLEIVDIYLWLYKRVLENKSVSPELMEVFRDQYERSFCSDFSLKAIEDRWSNYFQTLPDPTPEQQKKAQELTELDEARRKSYLA